MAILRNEEIVKMKKKEIEEKLKDLNMELVKSKIGTNKNTKKKEIKRTIARLLTFNRLNSVETKDLKKSLGKTKQ